MHIILPNAVHNFAWWEYKDISTAIILDSDRKVTSMVKKKQQQQNTCHARRLPFNQGS